MRKCFAKLHELDYDLNLSQSIIEHTHIDMGGRGR